MESLRQSEREVFAQSRKERGEELGYCLINLEYASIEGNRIGTKLSLRFDIET